MKSVPPADYASLPKLRRPAAYICVIRDVDCDRYRIQATHDPRSLIEAALTERPREFGIELLAILESDNIAASEARLYERHHAELGEEWLALDDYQLRELQRSELKVYTHRSRYIGPGEIPSPEQAQPTESELPPSQSHALQLAPRDRRDEARGSIRQPATGSIRYGAQSLRRRGGLLSSSELQSDHSRRSIRQAIDEAITDLWTKHPWKCLAALVLVVLFCLATVDWSCSRYGRCPDPRSTSTNRPVQPTASTEQLAASSGLSYRVLQAVAARECPAPSCAAVSRLPAGAEIRSLGMVQGGEVDGSAAWIRFLRNGETLFIPRSRLSLNR